MVVRVEGWCVCFDNSTPCDEKDDRRRRGEDG